MYKNIMAAAAFALHFGSASATPYSDQPHAFTSLDGAFQMADIGNNMHYLMPGSPIDDAIKKLDNDMSRLLSDFLGAEIAHDPEHYWESEFFTRFYDQYSDAMAGFAGVREFSNIFSLAPNTEPIDLCLASTIHSYFRDLFDRMEPFLRENYDNPPEMLQFMQDIKSQITTLGGQIERQLERKPEERCPATLIGMNFT